VENPLDVLGEVIGHWRKCLDSDVAVHSCGVSLGEPVEIPSPGAPAAEHSTCAGWKALELTAAQLVEKLVEVARRKLGLSRTLGHGEDSRNVSCRSNGLSTEAAS
jgi:hypothetical protein